MTELDSKHNALGGNSADQLRAYVNRVERLEDEIKGLQDGKSDVYKEAKACGFDVPTLRKLIRRRRKDRTELEDEDALLQTYEEVMLTGQPKDPLDY